MHECPFWIVLFLLNDQLFYFGKRQHTLIHFCQEKVLKFYMHFIILLLYALKLLYVF